MDFHIGTNRRKGKDRKKGVGQRGPSRRNYLVNIDLLRNRVSDEDTLHGIVYWKGLVQFVDVRSVRSKGP